MSGFLVAAKTLSRQHTTFPPVQMEILFRASFYMEHQVSQKTGPWVSFVDTGNEVGRTKQSRSGKNPHWGSLMLQIRPLSGRRLSWWAKAVIFLKNTKT